MSEIDENLIAQANKLLDMNDLLVSGSVMLGKEKQMINGAQLSTAENLRKFLEQYEQSQKEQAKESRFNRWLSIASLVIAVISMFIAAVK